jgi:copper oxidase (laccase) domain-containing protein/GNAT superfamily N-acetyltransferase
VIACPVETFPALNGLPFVRGAFLQRCPGIDVVTDRETALARLWEVHRTAAAEAGFAGLPFAIAEQVHSNLVSRVDSAESAPAPGADGLVTNRRDVCLAIYVADCAAIYLVDKKERGIGLVHSGRKGTEQNIVGAAIEKMRLEYGCAPQDLVVQISPCIRPPHYEVDIAPQIVNQAKEAGVIDVHDCGTCTASDPEHYYSYRREMGRTGRLLALLAFAPKSMRIAHLQEHSHVIPVLADLCGTEWAHLYENWDRESSRQEFFASRADGQLPMTLVALEGDELLGTVSLIHNDLPGREDLNPWLASLIVLPQYRGQHVATFLITEAERLLQQQGMPAAYLFTEKAGGLFAKLGWVAFDKAEANGHAVTIFRKEF